MFMSVHKGEGGVKIVPNPVHVVCERPLTKKLKLKKNSLEKWGGAAARLEFRKNAFFTREFYDEFGLKLVIFYYGWNFLAKQE